MVTLNKKDSEKLLRRMIAKERAPITKAEKKLAEEVRELGRFLDENSSSYLIKDGIITITRPVSFKVDRLLELLKASQKLKKGQIMTSIVIKLKGGKTKNGKKR